MRFRDFLMVNQYTEMNILKPKKFTLTQNTIPFPYFTELLHCRNLRRRKFSLIDSTDRSVSHLMELDGEKKPQCFFNSSSAYSTYNSAIKCGFVLSFEMIINVKSKGRGIRIR